MGLEKTIMVLTVVPCSEHEQAFKTGKHYKAEYENMERYQWLDLILAKPEIPIFAHRRALPVFVAHCLSEALLAT